MKTTDYQRGYQKGHYTGLTRGQREAATAYDEAKRAAQRAEEREKAMGIGHCEECAHWQRGGDTCSWGYCNVPRSAGTPWGTWVKPEHGDGRVITTPRFGCVLFMLKNSLSGFRVVHQFECKRGMGWD